MRKVFMANVFISYSHQDNYVAERVAEFLSDNGHLVWWDKRLFAGEDFSAAIENALKNAAVVIVIWTRSSVDSHWVRAEATHGLDHRKLIPLIIDDVIPPLEFRQIHHITIENPHIGLKQGEMNLLLMAIKRIADDEDTPAPLQSKADPLADLRTRLIAANTYWELKEGLYDLEAYIARNPNDTGARLLHDQYTRAAVYATTPPCHTSSDPHAMSSGGTPQIFLAVFILCVFVGVLKILGFGWLASIGIAIAAIILFVLVIALIIRIRS
jgi:TIR domain-containing protein